MFTEAEHAALALTEEGTRLADTNHGVSDVNQQGGSYEPGTSAAAFN